MDTVPISNCANPHCPNFDDLKKFDQEHKIEGKLDYEDIRKRNIERNKLILRSLGLSLMAQEMKIPAKPKTKKASKVKTEVVPKILPKRSRSQSQLEEMSNGKESQHQEKKSNPAIEKPQQTWNGENFFGAIPGVPVGTHWETRMDCCYSGVHRHTVAGIHWGPEGAYSVALSGGYEDDIDLGESFTYTGEGGRDLKGTKNCPKNLRTAPQSKDQSLDRGNLALAKSCLNKKPIRVIRGYKLTSSFAPDTGYRYDGLYTIKHYWQDVGLSGYRVFKYVFVRCPDQDPSPWETSNDNTTNGSSSFAVTTTDHTVDPMDAIANEEAIEVSNKILKLFGEDPQSDNDNNATVLDTTNTSYADLINGWAPLIPMPDADLEAVAKTSLASLTADLNRSFDNNSMLPLAIPEKVTFVPGNPLMEDEEEQSTKQRKGKQQKRKQQQQQEIQQDKPPLKKQKNAQKKILNNDTDDINNNNNTCTQTKMNGTTIKEKKKEKAATTKKEKSEEKAHKEKSPKTSLTLKNGELVCCRAPPNPSNDYYWIAKVSLSRDQQTFANSRQKVQVQWFEKDPYGREMHYYLSNGFDKIETGSIFYQGFKLTELPKLALYRLDEDLRKYDG